MMNRHGFGVGMHMEGEKRLIGFLRHAADMAHANRRSVSLAATGLQLGDGLMGDGSEGSVGLALTVLGSQLYIVVGCKVHHYV